MTVRILNSTFIMASNDSVMNGPGLELLASLEQQFVESKTLHLKGKARVRLSQLSFPNPIRPIDPKLVKVLKRNFKGEGCLQQDSIFSLPAIIDDNSLTLALEELDVSADRFKADSILSPAKFELPHNIQLACLHGQHRVAAAKQLLGSGNKWWLVDIYGQGTCGNHNTESLLTAIRRTRRQSTTISQRRSHLFD